MPAKDKHLPLFRTAVFIPSESDTWPGSNLHHQGLRNLALRRVCLFFSSCFGFLLLAWRVSWHQNPLDLGGDTYEKTGVILWHQPINNALFRANSSKLPQICISFDFPQYRSHLMTHLKPTPERLRINQPPKLISDPPRWRCIAKPLWFGLKVSHHWDTNSAFAIFHFFRISQKRGYTVYTRIAATFSKGQTGAFQNSEPKKDYHSCMQTP